MSRELLKCFLPLPTGDIVGKMHMSSKCTQHVITGFQVPLPPVTVSSLHLHSKVPFPAKCTLLLRRLHNLKILEISGPFMCPVLKALEDDNLVPSLERISVERQYVSLYRTYRDELISQRQPDRGQLGADA